MSKKLIQKKKAIKIAETCRFLSIFCFNNKLSLKSFSRIKFNDDKNSHC